MGCLNFFNKIIQCEKKVKNGNFQTVVSLLYAHYPILF